MDPDIIHKITLSASRLQIVKYMHVGSLVILLFDYSLTLHLEINLIWPSKRSFTKAFFLLSRYSAAVDVPLMVYYAVAPDISIQRCHQVHTVLVYLNLLGIGIAEAIFIIRTYALSGQNRKVLAVFTMILVVHCM